MRVLLSRERFANGLRVYGIDQDEQQEYAGRFCDYLGGSRVAIRTVLDAEAFSFADVANPDVVIWDLHESDERDRGAIFAALKAHLVAYLLEHPGRAAFIVDEAVTVTEDELGAAEQVRIPRALVPVDTARPQEAHRVCEEAPTRSAPDVAGQALERKRFEADHDLTWLSRHREGQAEHREPDAPVQQRVFGRDRDAGSMYVRQPQGHRR